MSLVITSGFTPLFAQPSETSERVDEALQGMKVQALGAEEGGYLYVETEYRYKGWVRQENTAPWEPLLEAHHITALMADVLAAPKVQAPLLLCLPMGGRVQLLEAGEEWAKIKLANSRTGYVRSAFLAPEAKEGELPLRTSLCEAAKRYLGVQYRWGGKTAWGIDCSGLCFMAYWLNGIAIFRDARIEEGFPIQKISPDKVQPGDLLFFPGHVGLCLGEGLMIHASQKGNGVAIETFNSPLWEDKLLAAGSVFIG